MCAMPARWSQKLSEFWKALLLAVVRPPALSLPRPRLSRFDPSATTAGRLMSCLSSTSEDVAWIGPPEEGLDA